MKKILLFLFILILVGCQPIEKEITKEEPTLIEKEELFLEKEELEKKPILEKERMDVAVRITNCKNCINDFFRSISGNKRIIKIERGPVIDLITIEYNPREITPLEILAEINRVI